MTAAFDFSRIVEDQTEFRVAFGRGKTPALSFVKIEQSLRDYLNGAVQTTVDSMRALGANGDSATDYDPSNIHEGKSNLFIPLDSPFTVKARYFHEPEDVPILSDPLKHLAKISLYMARLVDADGGILTAAKGTSDFGRRVKSPALMGLFGQGLGIEQEARFELYEDFDFLIDDGGVHVFRPKTFESVCDLDDVIRNTVNTNAEYLAEKIPFVDFAPFTQSPSIRSARAFASIRGHQRFQRVDKDILCDHCTRLKLKFELVEDRIRVDPESQELFLRLVNRQILGIEFVAGELETYHAGNRTAFGATS